MFIPAFRRATAFFAIASFAVIGACKDSTGTSDLSQAEVEDMFDALSAIGAVGFVKKSNTAKAVITTTYNETDPCPGGGTVTYSGTDTYNDVTYAYTDQSTTTFNNCKAESSSGRMWTFNGDPNIQFNMSGSYNPSTGNSSDNGTMSGKFKYSANVGSGSCSVNLNFSSSSTSNGYSFSITGTMCGKSINESYSG